MAFNFVTLGEKTITTTSSTHRCYGSKSTHDEKKNDKKPSFFVIMAFTSVALKK